jgi:YARHG domain/WG containing repeat
MKENRTPFVIAKFISIFALALIVVFFAFVFLRKKDVDKPEKAEIERFLYNFQTKINEGKADSLLSYFDASKKTKATRQLLNFLSGKTDINGQGKPIAKIALDVYGSSIAINDDDGLAEVNVPVNFSRSSFYPRSSVINFEISKVGPHKFKILQLGFDQFLSAYADYKKEINDEIVPDSVFKPITLAAFKTATELRKTYDSVIWFAHNDNKTFYYVLKGKWNIKKDLELQQRYYMDSVKDDYKMGLVGADLKEIIPVDYDLIHNIGGTFPGMIEVEKDEKKGFYTLTGKLVVPIKYDQIFPIEDENNLAVLKDGNGYYYLKNDTSISERVDLKIDDFLPKIKYLRSQFDLYENARSVITEYNSRKENGTIYIAPSYLVDLNLAQKVLDFKNPLRDKLADEVHETYEVKNAGKIEGGENWLQATFYSIRDYFLGGRSDFYDRKSLVIIDKKRDRVFSTNVRDDYSNEEGEVDTVDKFCDLNSNIKIINDSLFELKSAAILSIELYDQTKVITGGSYYHYLSIRNNKLIELPDKRNFAFTKYIKMDDSYLTGCYNMVIGTGGYDTREKKTIDHVTDEMLRVMKNEIYADYRYQFKDSRWKDIFKKMYFYNYSDNKTTNANVDDSLTEIDKYNISWINQKLKGIKTQSNTLAVK